tara:strand:+ start:10399 stop:10542 length:144 start_codon:yes stop_codon:yes gene_type:complete
MLVLQSENNGSAQWIERFSTDLRVRFKKEIVCHFKKAQLNLTYDKAD